MSIFHDYLIIFAFILWALATSFSRVFLGRHYVSDIVGGTIIALFTTFLVTGFSYKPENLMLNDLRYSSYIVLPAETVRYKYKSLESSIHF